MGSELVALFAIVVGLLVGALWVGSLWRGRVPELATRPWEIRLHIAAETLLAATMLTAGSLTLAGVTLGPPLLLLGLGMTIYSIVNSAGYYLERRQVAPIAMFALLGLLTLLAAASVVAASVA